jgi:hypothetical protein
MHPRRPVVCGNLAGSLVKHQETSPADALTGAITETAAAHGNTCDLDHPGTPSAALAIAQVHGDALRYLVLGDVPLHVIRRVVLLTDGAARAISPFKIYDWPGIFSVVTDKGPRSLIKQVRIAEDADYARCHPALSDDGSCRYQAAGQRFHR